MEWKYFHFWRPRMRDFYQSYWLHSYYSDSLSILIPTYYPSISSKIQVCLSIMEGFQTQLHQLMRVCSPWRPSLSQIYVLNPHTLKLESSSDCSSWTSLLSIRNIFNWGTYGYVAPFPSHYSKAVQQIHFQNLYSRYLDLQIGRPK